MTHHAYIYEGSLSELGTLAEDARVRFGFETEHSPDVHVREFEKFGIDESRWLTATAALKPSSGRTLFVIGISSTTSEAQQALLKLLEEPQAGTTFVLLLPHGLLLPTLRSRMLGYPHESMPAIENQDGPGEPGPSWGGDWGGGNFSGQARAFLTMSGKDRSDLIAKLLKDDEGTKERVRDFVNTLEAELASRTRDAKVRQGLEDIAMVRTYLADRSPSLKMLLEHLALSLPKLGEIQ